jgi:hypothetical protein
MSLLHKPAATSTDSRRSEIKRRFKKKKTMYWVNLHMQIVKTANANSQDSKRKIYVLMVAVLDYYTPSYVSSNEEATENMQGKQDSILNDKFNG